MTVPDQAATEQWIDELALQIGRRRLEAPAIALLEVGRPLSFLASQGLLLVQPLLGFLFGESRAGGYADLLADRANVDRLIAELESGPASSAGGGEERD